MNTCIADISTKVSDGGDPISTQVNAFSKDALI